MKIKSERLASLLVTSALFGTNIELSNHEKNVVCIESPSPQHNLSTFNELIHHITEISISNIKGEKCLIAFDRSEVFDLSQLQIGNYILTITLTNGEISRKLNIHEQEDYAVVRA
ncbi:T9SS type A sorting domain-containing protein [Flammeovirga sp. MY04]|uniref:T9SS type A sorting domain-containing protein n=1 Tax=Flammeovirga sp. MY04 TaxID=1191459 RepID=UPI00082669BD|nr:T9SS type A sorting domain-containing protein [Flammeovirga sp. MY04]ANQ50787.2 T9SS type A sorting domain-containing protein [Flammeovirga sp. MY04]